MAAAFGLPGVLPEGRSGDPDNDGGWFLTDWVTSLMAEASSFMAFTQPQILRCGASPDAARRASPTLKRKLQVSNDKIRRHAAEVTIPAAAEAAGPSGHTDGHRAGTAGAGVPAPFLAGHARRDERVNGVEALPAATRRSAGPDVSTSSIRLPQRPRPLRRCVEGDRREAGRAGAGGAAAELASRGPAGSRRSADCGTSRWRPVFRRPRGSSAR